MLQHNEADPMKLQLLTIGVLALLLCTVLPISVAAGPVKAPSPTIEQKLYSSAFDSSGKYIPGQNIGKIVIDKQTGIWTITAHTNVYYTPGEHFLIVTGTGPKAVAGLNLGTVYADANGNIIDATGTSAFSIQDIQRSLDNGGWFLVL